MSDVTVTARWTGEMRFEATGKAGIPMLMDGDGEAAFTPVEALGASLAGCMAADVVDILTRMRVPLTELEMRLEGDRRAEPPRSYTAMRLLYRVGGVSEEDRPKLVRAVELSRNKYCSVLHTLQPDLDLSISVETD